jgi:hypothetical protein
MAFIFSQVSHSQYKAILKVEKRSRTSENIYCLKILAVGLELLTGQSYSSDSGSSGRLNCHGCCCDAPARANARILGDVITRTSVRRNITRDDGGLPALNS